MPDWVHTGVPVHVKKVNGIDLYVFKQAPPSRYLCVVSGHWTLHGDAIVSAMQQGETYARAIQDSGTNE